MGEYYTVSCYDENGDPAAAPAGTWYHLNGYADPADYPATATTAYSASTAGGILDPHRTTIGIGEQVSCWIANWEDREWDNTTQEYVYDALGSVNWTTDNEYATVSPNVGSTTTFTAPLLTTNDGNQDVTITMTAQNLGGTDTATGTVTFSVLRPSGVQVFTHQDVWTSDPQPWSWAGADTVFFLQIEPTDVSFCNIYIREHILAATYPNWPNGNPNTSGTYISAPVKPEADNTGLGDKMGDCVNLTYFWNGTNYTNYSWTLEGNSIWWYEYLDRNGGYSQFAYPTDTASFTASTETLREVYSGVAGSAQGPFQTYHTP